VCKRSTARGCFGRAAGVILGLAVSRAVLRIRPATASGLRSLTRALAGEGRPAGIGEVVESEGTIDVTLDPSVTSLGLLVAVVDAALGGTARTIEPLVGLDDDVLASFASERLGDPELDGARVLEAYL